MDLSKEFITKQQELIKLSQLMTNASIDVKEQYTINYINEHHKSNQRCDITDDDITQIINSENNTLFEIPQYNRRYKNITNGIYNPDIIKLLTSKVNNFTLHINAQHYWIVIPFLAKLAKKYNYNVQFIVLLAYNNLKLELDYDDMTDDDIKHNLNLYDKVSYKVHFRDLDSGGI